MNETDERIEAHYDDLAPHWAEIVDSPKRTELVWPTVDRLLPDVAELHVLDAGCGSGVYAEILVERGAEVTGVDLSTAMVEEARERVPEATFHEADLAEGLDILDTNSVDVVLCQHVFSHLPDLSQALAAFARVLRDGGTLVVSTHNPVHDYVVVRDREYPASGEEAHLDPRIEAPAGAPNYGETERFDVVRTDAEASNRGTYYRRPIEGLFTPIIDAGFTIEGVVEPIFDDGHELAPDDDGADYPPDTICLRASS